MKKSMAVPIVVGTPGFATQNFILSEPRLAQFLIGRAGTTQNFILSEPRLAQFLIGRAGTRI